MLRGDLETQRWPDELHPMIDAANSGILFAGIAKNVGRAIRHTLNNVDNYGKLFRDYKVFIVENGSYDGTKEYLRTWARQKVNRVHIEADDVCAARSPQNPRGPDTPLLAAFRNPYMERIEQEDAERYPFVGIMDCDDVNVRPVNCNSILAGIRFLCAEPSRAAVLANQRGYYYDIWALRHDVWCPGDCWQEFRAWSQVGLAREAGWACIGSRQVHIPTSASPIEVESAFGGFAIYKTEFLRGRRYSDFGEDGAVACEHVSLHREIRKLGGRLFIFAPLSTSTPYRHIKRPRDFYYWSIRLKEMLK